jgi:hypothetical protein
MRRPGPLLSAGCAFVLSFSSSGLVGASDVPGRLIRLADGGGFRLVSERLLPNGAAVATFRAGEVTVSVIGRPGSSASIRLPDSASALAAGTLRASLSTTRPKTAKDATAYRDSGRTVISDLVALGMPRRDAERQFGDLATLDADGDADLVARKAVTLASAPAAPAVAAPTRAAPAAASTPYDAQCAAINVADGKITGYGCTTLFLVHRDGNDWWLTTKMKVSAHSSDESWFSPKRLTQLGWRLSWSAGNVLYDWDPYQTRAIGSCLTMTVKSSSPWAEVSVQGTVCPDSLGPWSVTTARSGGIWNGMEDGTEYEGALATQAVHSPPGVPVSFQSAWTLSYCDLWCN